MSIAIHRRGRPSARRLLYGGLAFGAAATLTACGSSATTKTSSPPAGGPASPPASPGSGSPGTSTSSAITIGTKDVSGFGTVLANSKGQTLYMLTSEKGGEITCTDDNGCTKVWPDTELPKGTTEATAGSGIQGSLLGTVKNADGDLYVTYHGWPLYTYAGDSGPAETHGEGLTSFGGTWYVLNAAGTPVTSAHTQSSGSSSGGSSRGTGGSMSNGNGGGSYGY